LTYLRWLAIFLCLPLAVLWLTHFRLLWSQRRTIRTCAVWALILSVPWDGWAIRTRIWTFPADTHLGFRIAGLPLEEYLFIVCAAILISSLTLVLGVRAGRWLTRPPPG
jgi:lycopene cyclase domain-containing protein